MMLLMLLQQIGAPLTRRFSLFLLVVFCTACGISVPSSASNSTAVAPAATLSRIPRTNNPKDIILATTTSTQDSGLLDVLLPRFEQQSGFHVKVIAVGSGAAIALGARGEADVVLAHAPDSERQFVSSGSGIDRKLVMFNDFVLVGPAADPAQVKGMSDILTAFKAIAQKQSAFISRGDNSGTEQLERKLWMASGINPEGQTWYIQSGTGMGQTLQIADQKQAYTISDRGTFLAFTSRISLTVLAEKDERLLNVYHVIAVNPDKFPQVNKAGAQAFSAFLVAPETQAFIKTFGQDKYGQSLFTPCANNACHLPQADE
jgi:tungstate transport system substrate-binding protein